MASYKYDNANRLTEGAGTAIEYDNASNPTKVGGTELKYDKASQLEKAGSTSYAFDKLGERTQAGEGAAALKYGYDQAGNMISVKRETPSINDSYAYDGSGLRQSETISGTTKHLAWDTAEELPLVLYDGTNYYLDGPEGLPFEQIASETSTYLHHDQAGSTRLLTAQAGTTLRRLHIDLRGNLRGAQWHGDLEPPRRRPVHEPRHRAGLPGGGRRPGAARPVHERRSADGADRGDVWVCGEQSGE